MYYTFTKRIGADRATAGTPFAVSWLTMRQKKSRQTHHCGHLPKPNY